MLKEMKLSGLIIDPSTNTPIIILKDLEEKEVLPIWIGLLEASAIAIEMEKINLPRPMTHDLIKNMLTSLDIQVSGVEVTDLKDDTFYALIHLTKDGKPFEIDARPSDAIALALRTQSPIRVDERVIKKSKKLNLEGIKNTNRDDTGTEWKDLLENMSPEDFKYKM
jgi:bifunctional DNase/RNase